VRDASWVTTRNLVRCERRLRQAHHRRPYVKAPSKSAVFLRKVTLLSAPGFCNTPGINGDNAEIGEDSPFGIDICNLPRSMFMRILRQAAHPGFTRHRLSDQVDMGSSHSETLP
jgi:hypothetical protein